jgi:signal recognition particle subunit SRP54
MTGIFRSLRGRGVLREEDLDQVLRDIRVALLEADVSLPLTRTFLADVKADAVGQNLMNSLSPDQLIVKIVHDHMVKMLGNQGYTLNVDKQKPAVILFAGLQGSGKTTGAAKIAHFLKTKNNKNVLLASTDIYRPAAREQLAILGQQAGVDTLPLMENEKPLSIVKRALQAAMAYDVLGIDTAGRLHLDDALMAELKEIVTLSKPAEIILVMDAMTGQDALGVAEAFAKAVPLTSLMLSRMDSDARGGAALSLRAATSCPIAFLGTGEKISDLTPFFPDRLAGRILGMGDVVSLVEKAQSVVSEKEAKDLEKKLRRGQFDFNDMLSQMRQMRNMGSIGSLLGMIPGMGQIKEQINNDEATQKMRQVEAIICSMTPKERRDPKLLNASRKIRIAKGAGRTVQDVNLLLKQHLQMSQMMKSLGRMNKHQLRQMGRSLGFPKG